MRSTDTWISLDERPPPKSQETAREKCWCFFATDDGREDLGYFLGEGVVHVAGQTGQRQQRFALDRYTHWQPLSWTRLEEFERRG